MVCVNKRPIERSKECDGESGTGIDSEKERKGDIVQCELATDSVAVRRLSVWAPSTRCYFCCCVRRSLLSECINVIAVCAALSVANARELLSTRAIHKFLGRLKHIFKRPQESANSHPSRQFGANELRFRANYYHSVGRLAHILHTYTDTVASHQISLNHNKILCSLWSFLEFCAMKMFVCWLILRVDVDFTTIED